MPIVVIERGNDKGRSIKVEPGKRYLFGRDPNVPITLSDPLASRRHFEILSEDGSFVLNDLGSTNGTFLNDDRIDRQPLTVGDKIQVGETILSFLSDQREETAQGLVGKTIGGYKILERVGRGGMGTVYKANQLSLNRIVAFKVLSARLLKDEKFIEKFKSEARAAGALNHPNIVGVYDVGTDRNIHFFSMEFMDGGSVQDLIGKDGKLSWEEALDVLMQSARALIFAEKKGIVHRDVKPDNLMLTSDGQTKLADLGLAKKLDGTPAAAEEGIFGTPHFISPEQAQGREIDHRADLYSLGATAYRILSGRTPFSGSNVGEIVSAQISKEPEPLRKLAPEAPEELVGVVGKLMSKSPDDRHSSAEELFAELERIRLKYHLKLHGGGGGKGVIAAVAVALLAVVAVVLFALNRNDDGGNGNGTIVQPETTRPPETVTVVEPNPEEKRRQRERDAENAYLKVQVREGREIAAPLDESALRLMDPWREIASAYDEVATEYEGTPFGGRAADRATKIRETIEKLQREREEQLESANRRWVDLKEEVNTALDEGRFADALRTAADAAGAADVKQALRIVPGAAEEHAAWLSDAPGSIRARFSRAFTATKDAVAAQREAGAFAEAAGALKAFIERAASDEVDPPFGPARQEAKRLLEEMIAEQKERLAAALQADRALYYETWLAARHVDLPDPVPAGMLFPDNPVFSFSFETAAARFDALAAGPGADGSLATDLFRDRAVASAARLRRCAALLATLVERVNSGDLSEEDLEFPPSISGGANISLSINREDGPPANEDGLSVIKRFSGTSAVGKDRVDWADFSPGQLWRNVFLSGERFDMAPADHARAAIFLALAGVRAGLAEEIAAAGDALAPADRAWIDPELAAIGDHVRLLEAKATRPPAKWIELAGEFNENHCHTDFFILVYGEPTPWQRLHLQGTIDGWREESVKPVRDVLDWIEKRIAELGE